MREVLSVVGGELVPPGDDRLEVLDPATGEVIAVSADLDERQVAGAVAAARAAFPGWAARPPAARAEVLRRAGDLLAERAAGVVDDLVAEGGKPVREARAEVVKSIATFRYYAGLAGALDGRAFAGGRERLRHETRLEPVGVVAAVTPWNVPAAGPARKLAPALLAGDCVILKPATATPITALHLVRCLADAGADPGAVSLVCGRGSRAGQALVTDPRVAAVSFTGSTAVGLDLKSALGRTLTRLQLELGGKNAALVLADADLAAAAEWIVGAAFALAGQQCTATSRVVVADEVHDALVEQLLVRVRALRVGDPRQEATDMGPLIDERHRREVHGYVERAAKTARVATGGQDLPGPGTFYAPTVLTEVTSGQEVAREEVFGPVLAVLRCASLDDGLEILNEPAYGLSAAVHTCDLAAAQKVAARAECGVVAVNGPTSGIELAAPFGGFKLSGTDSKEHGPESLSFYTRTKLVSWGWR